MLHRIRTIVSVAGRLATMTPAQAALRVLATTMDWAALRTELGDRFTVLKVRDELAPRDYRNPGWYPAPAGTVAARVSTDADFGAQFVDGLSPDARQSKGLVYSEDLNHETVIRITFPGVSVGVWRGAGPCASPDVHAGRRQRSHESAGSTRSYVL